MTLFPSIPKYKIAHETNISPAAAHALVVCKMLRTYVKTVEI